MTKSSINTNDIPDNYLAALDIGSNSFHFVYARLINNNLQILHSEKYRVKLADGLNSNNILDKNAIERGVDTLTRLASTVVKLSPNNFRVVATYTLRQAKNAQVFLDAAAKVFPFDIEIISGHEEARLIYQGVAHYSPPNEQQLVIDIGGGSTECVIGQQHQVKTLTSINIGCVSFHQRFFLDNKITDKQFSKAIKAAKIEIAPILKRFKKVGWQNTIGTSGTIKSLYNIINANTGINDILNKQVAKKSLATPINAVQLQQLKQQLIKFGDIDNVKLKALKDNRREVLCSGLAILIALMESLAISELEYCSYALREGVLYEQLQLREKGDIKQRTVNGLQQRFSIDTDHADNVKALALSLFNQCTATWHITANVYANLLQWAAQLHEIGIDINSSGYHKHGRYILNNADLAGFNQEQQQALAWLVGSHRKQIASTQDQHWYLLNENTLIKVCVLLRLAVLLNQQRQLSDTPTPVIMASNNTLQLVVTKQWLLERPLVDSDLSIEQQALASIDINLVIKAI